MDDGAIVEFDAGDDHLLGVITRDLGEKFIVVTEEGDEMRPTEDEIRFVLDRSVDASAGTDRIVSELESLRSDIEAVADEIDVGFLWEFVDGGERVTPAALSELFFESQSPEEIIAIGDRLRDDPLYFKERGDQFEAREESQVEELRRQIEAERERARKREAFVERTAALLEMDEGAREERAQEAMGEPEFREYAEVLQEYAIYDRGYHDRDEALELMDAIEEELGSALEGDYGTKAFRLMVRLGIWDEHENLWLHRYNLGSEPDEEVRERADDVSVDDWEPEEWRRDWTDRHLFSIDAAETRDIDDALSVRELEDGGLEVGVHIADPSAFIDAGDVLDRHARRRGESIYLPTRTIPMLPARVSEEVASLVEGELRPAISVTVQFDDELEPVDRDIAPSVVRVDDRLTYDRADELLSDGEGPLAQALRRLERAADANRERREERGALAIDLPDPDLDVRREDGEITIECDIEGRGSPSHELVSECMILANTIFGKFCRNRDIPVVFRTQEAPDRPLDDEEIRSVPEGRPRQFAKLYRMKPGNLTTEPGEHAGLGVSVYTQATSPIRRYTDLVCQRQIKAYLADEELPHDADQMVDLLGRLENTSREAGRTQGETQRYWLLEYLRRHGDEPMEGTVVEHNNDDGTRAGVWIESVAQKFEANLRKTVPVGETVEVVVEASDPRRDEVTVVEA